MFVNKLAIWTVLIMLGSVTSGCLAEGAGNPEEAINFVGDWNVILLEEHGIGSPLPISLAKPDADKDALPKLRFTNSGIVYVLGKEERCGIAYDNEKAVSVGGDNKYRVDRNALLIGDDFSKRTMTFTVLGKSDILLIQRTEDGYFLALLRRINDDDQE